MQTISQNNLIVALARSISYQRDYERTRLGYTRDSAQVAGWQEVLDAAKKGEKIVVTQDD